MTDKEMEQKTKMWSLRLALASDDEDWDEVNAVCSEINAAYCDLAYGEDSGKEAANDSLQ